MVERSGAVSDLIGTWLRSLTPTTAVFCRAVMSAPWGFRIEAREGSTFHIVTRGSGILEVDGLDDPIELETGDMVVLTHGAAHQVRDRPQSNVLPLEQAVASGTADGKVFSFGGEGTRAVFVCGGFQLGPLRGVDSRMLPSVLRYRCEPQVIRLVDQESESLAIGTETVLKSLLNLLVTQALRAHLVSRELAEEETLGTPGLVAAVAFIHSSLDRDVELSDVCAAAGLSRGALSERFNEAFGVSPIQYLRKARLDRAADLLERTGLSLQRIARSVGYRSMSAFGRAFRQEYGLAPGAYRERVG